MLFRSQFTLTATPICPEKLCDRILRRTKYALAVLQLLFKKNWIHAENITSKLYPLCKLRSSANAFTRLYSYYRFLAHSSSEKAKRATSNSVNGELKPMRQLRYSAMRANLPITPISSSLSLALPRPRHIRR